MTALGIDQAALRERSTDETFFEKKGLGRGVFFDRETLAAITSPSDWAGGRGLKALAQAPLSDPAGETSSASVGEHRLPPGVSTAAKKQQAAQDRLRRL